MHFKKQFHACCAQLTHALYVLAGYFTPYRVQVLCISALSAFAVRLLTAYPEAPVFSTKKHFVRNTTEYCKYTVKYTGTGFSCLKTQKANCRKCALSIRPQGSFIYFTPPCINSCSSEHQVSLLLCLHLKTMPNHPLPTTWALHCPFLFTAVIMVPHSALGLLCWPLVCDTRWRFHFSLGRAKREASKNERRLIYHPGRSPSCHSLQEEEARLIFAFSGHEQPGLWRA